MDMTEVPRFILAVLMIAVLLCSCIGLARPIAPQLRRVSIGRALRILGLVALTTFGGLPPLIEGHWQALPDDTAKSGRWEKSASMFGMPLYTARASCFLWWSPDTEEWHWSAAMQPLFRKRLDICTDYREPWYK